MRLGVDERREELLVATLVTGCTQEVICVSWLRGGRGGRVE